MSFKLEWDKSGKREYELGVSRGVLFPMTSGSYGNAVAWNGLTSVEENPDGADINDIWADNIKYASFQSPENHKGTIKAYMFPDEFYPCNGMAVPSDLDGMAIGGQARKSFGLCYRTEIGTDTDEAAGYKLHFVYNCKIQPTSRSHQTKNENPDPEEMSWEYSSTPVPVTGITGVTQTSFIEVNSMDFTGDKASKLAALESFVYGTAASGNDAAVEGQMPTPAQIYSLLKTGSAS